MECWNPQSLTRFVNFVSLNDQQIVAHRREARALFAVSRGGSFDYSYEKMEKIETFLSSEASQIESSVSIYAFVKLIGELRRRLAAGETFTEQTIPPEQPGVQGGLVSPALVPRQSGGGVVLATVSDSASPSISAGRLSLPGTH